MTGLMKGKRGLIMGIANDHSIAWGIAQALAARGEHLANFELLLGAAGRRLTGRRAADQAGTRRWAIRSTQR